MPARGPLVLALLRVVLGVIFVSHGVPKLAGGIGATAGFFGQLGIPLPTLSAWFIALLETLGGLALVVGVLVAPIAILLSIHMLLGILLVHLPSWYVVGPGTGGAEFNAILIAGLLVLVVLGPGAAALGGRPERPV